VTERVARADVDIEGSGGASVPGPKPALVAPATHAVTALLTEFRQPRILARCAGACTCGGSCRTAFDPEQEDWRAGLLARSGSTAVLALQRAAGNRNVAAALSSGRGRTLARCEDRCTCRSRAPAEDALEEHARAAQAVAGAVLARKPDAAGRRLLQRAEKQAGEPGRRPDLWVGDTGPAVTLLQSRLAIKQTGVFDEPTRLAVVAFRKATFGEKDPAGGVGPQTWMKLDELAGERAKPEGTPGSRPNLWVGDTGPAVTLLQRRLNIRQSGVFDEATRLEVVKFRKLVFNEAAPAGGVGPQTWQKLDEMAEKQRKTGLCGTWKGCSTPANCDVPDSTSAAAGNTWEISLAIDLEVAQASDVTALGAEVGHAYVLFKGGDGRLWTFGFYPDPADPAGTPDPFNHPKVMGCIAHPDAIHQPCVDHHERYTVNADQYEKALTLARAFCKTPEKYHLKDFNCTTFAAKIVEAAGQAVPSYRGQIGGKGGVVADNPYALMESLKRDVPTQHLTDAGQIHAWLQSHSYDDIAKLPEAEKKRLIREVLKSYVRDRDLESVEWVCKGVKDRAEMERIDHEIRPLAEKLNSPWQRKRLEAALALRPS
jgi:hypothetical protein